MSFLKIPYDDTKVEATRVRLENHARIGEPINYAVVIDDLEVIPRTNDASLFSSIDELIGPTTKYVSISEYIGNTRNKKTTCFYFDGPSKNNSGSLNGYDEQTQSVSIEERVQRQVEQATLKQNHDRLQRENQTLRQQLDALMQRCDEMSEENSELRKLQDDNSNQSTLLALAHDALERFFGPKKTDGPLAGTPHQETSQNSQTPPNADGATHVAISEREYEDYKFFVALFQKFDPVQRGLISQLITLLGEHPEMIEEVFMNAYQKTQNDGNDES